MLLGICNSVALQVEQLIQATFCRSTIILQNLEAVNIRLRESNNLYRSVGEDRVFRGKLINRVAVTGYSKESKRLHSVSNFTLVRFRPSSNVGVLEVTRILRQESYETISFPTFARNEYVIKILIRARENTRKVCRYLSLHRCLTLGPTIYRFSAPFITITRKCY